MKTVISAILALALSACSTVSGVGRDISGMADWTKEKISGK